VSLFLKKHFFEKRRDSRYKINKEAEVMIDDVKHAITLKDKSSGGVAFVMGKAVALAKGAFVELVMDGGTRRPGVVVGEDNGVVHFSYEYVN
jgi:hypothetical protein